ncbi:unnamed protein product [Mytilus edulis]|uniref:Endonuclease/exonuclease/phosphatase domain-containing protein n=1 Tax=Mytilus edulis TaxID=6550 RepID=A0A8S3RJ69_MYTED|nr:unnamed protein product [Mytilus edulis]
MHSGQDLNVLVDIDGDENITINNEDISASLSGETAYLSKNSITDKKAIDILYVNCCGLKHRLQYPEFENLIRKHDVVCFVESKTDDMDDIHLSGYTLKFKNRRKISRVKSGGIVIGYRENLNNSIEVIETNSKFVLWCKISKFLNNEDILFGVVYIPPEYTSYSSPDAFNEIENEYLEFSTTFEHIFIIGDFNARTSNEKDYVFIDEKDISIDLEGVSINDVCNLELYNIPRDRISMDKGKTRYGNNLLDLCKCNNLFIMNGRLGNDKTGKFTCRNASVVDYCLSNVNVLEKLIDFDVLEFSHLYSDVHCPLYLRLESNSLTIDCNEQDSHNDQSRQKINKWDHKMVPEFRANINVDRLDRLLRNLKNVNLEKVDDNNVNAFVNEIGLVVLESAKTTFGTRTDKPKKASP